MPWKGEKDPYRIWLSEIILQQTRVEQGLSYYNNFIKAFPTVQKLAAAADKDVFKLWEGLGYYSRCRNLLATARFIATTYGGKFPDSYEEILKLKGVGPYTAAAIASFAFNLPHAVVDGNVFRILSRVFGISAAIDSTAGKKAFTALAGELLNKKQPGLYNQAIMDFGATVCKPVAPLCTECVFQKHCFAYREGMVNELPFKEKKLKIKNRFFYFYLLEQDHRFAFKERTGTDIWKHLYELPHVEVNAIKDEKDILEKGVAAGILQQKDKPVFISPNQRQKLTHQHIQAVFIHLKIARKPAALKAYQWGHAGGLLQHAFPKISKDFLNGYLRGLSPKH